MALRSPYQTIGDDETAPTEGKREDATDRVGVPCTGFNPISAADLAVGDSAAIVPTGDNRGAAIPRARGIRHSGGAIALEEIMDRNPAESFTQIEEMERFELERVHRKYREAKERAAELRHRH